MLVDDLKEWGFIDPAGHTCGECVRCVESKKKSCCICANVYRTDPITPDMAACNDFWSMEVHDAYEKRAAEERERKRLAEIEKGKLLPPIKLPIVFDGYGYIPMCPNCDNPPYDYSQCQCCGQRFLPSKAVEEYAAPLYEEMTCPQCGKVGRANKSRYNGHRHFSCECGFRFME